MHKDSAKKTLIVALLLCLVCSVMVSAAAVILRPIQDINKEVDRKKNILVAAGLLEPENSSRQEVESAFSQIKSVVVDLQKAQVIEGANPSEHTLEANLAKNTYSEIDSSQDIAGIKVMPQTAVVYVVQGEQGAFKEMILPVYGKGLWSTLKGYLALKSDLKTVEGLVFYEHGETPGLGGEVDNPNWKAQWKGKEVYGEQGDVKIRVIKGQVDKGSQEASYQVDGLSGATITSRGVSQLLQYWLGSQGFGPYIKSLQES